MSKFKHLGYVLDEPDPDDVGAVAGIIKSLVNAKGLQLECARVLHKGLIMPVLLHGSETIKWREKD